MFSFHTLYCTKLLLIVGLLNLLEAFFLYTNNQKKLKLVLLFFLGWPSSGGHYPTPQQRGYPSPQGASPSPHTPPQGATPVPAQSPGATPPQQPISPQPWGSSGGPGRGPPPPAPTSAQGPPPGATWPPQDPRYGPNSGSIMSPPPASGASSHSQPPWTTPGSQSPNQSRSGAPGGRPPFPGKPGPGEMYRGYGPSPSSLQLPPTSSSKSPMQPIMGTPQSMSQQGPAPPGFHPAPVPSSAVPMMMKKEVVFPVESVEAVTPVLSRRRKLHKNDVSPVEAWRIMMSLKSGLLAETTWALDVLNVLLYDDHSVSYFSLTYLPGLLDILLEHLRRALILLFGSSVGIDIISDKVSEAENTSVSIYLKQTVVILIDQSFCHFDLLHTYLKLLIFTAAMVREERTN